MKILITGARGFAGSHLIQELLIKTDWHIVSLERLKMEEPIHSGNRIHRVYHDFRAALQPALLEEIGPVDYIIHNGAEVHAIRSLTDPRSFVQSNAVGVFNMLEAARQLKPKKFIYTSSAEVFGPANGAQAMEDDDALNPSNPYSAAKAAGEMLCRAYFKSFGVPVNIVRTMNMFGEGQDDTKFVPMVAKKLFTGSMLKIHASKDLKDIGTRQWIYVKNYVSALMHILLFGAIGESYNIAGVEKNNEYIATEIGRLIGGFNLAYSLEEAPPTHDLHYRIDDKKLRNLGWVPPVSFEQGFENTVKWIQANR